MTRLLRRTSEGTACQPECSLTRSEDGGLAARGAWIGNRVQVPGLLGGDWQNDFESTKASQFEMVFQAFLSQRTP